MMDQVQVNIAYTKLVSESYQLNSENYCDSDLFQAVCNTGFDVKMISSRKLGSDEDIFPS